MISNKMGQAVKECGLFKKQKLLIPRWIVAVILWSFNLAAGPISENLGYTVNGEVEKKTESENNIRK